VTVIEEEQARMKKVAQMLEEKQEQLRKGVEDLMGSPGTGSKSLNASPFALHRVEDRLDDVDDPEFQDAMSHVSDDMFYDAKEERTVVTGDELDNRPFRKCLPVLRNPKQKINIWRIIKDSIGQELSKIAVPVYFNEPLSFLQRFTEDFTYSSLILTACAQPDSCLRLAYIACWLVSQYSFTANRLMKPFNPVLGETFELESQGMRIISEQVSHHPPVSALYCDHAKFSSWGNTEVKSNFKGTFLLVSPTGLIHLHLKEWNDHFTWNKPQTSVHNLILGKVYIDHHGDIVIANETTQDTCNLHMKKMGWFEKNPHSVEATIYDPRGIVRYSISGKWDQSLSIKDERTGETVGGWALDSYPEGYENNYFFTNYTLQLNLPPETYVETIAPTDSRYRPDQRALENGDVRQATAEKIRVEEKQRKARKDRADQHEEYAPKWFSLRNGEWVYHGGYWESKAKGRFDDSPDIF